MPKNKQPWETDEKEVAKLIKCPNCRKKLMLLPPNYPLCDVQCTGCLFRAQIKTVNSKPRNTLFGAGWEIMNKVLKSGYMVPSLLLNFKWKEKNKKKQEIRFYPFIPRVNLHKYKLSPTARRANYKMFLYRNIDKIPHFVLYKK